MLSGVVGWISVSVVEAQSFFFVVLIKENRILTMIRYRVKPNINILLIRNLPFGSGVRQWSRPLITLFEQFEREVNWFRFDFAHSHARYHLDRGVCNWSPKVKGVEELRMQMDRGGRKTSELGYFHGRHMCIIPKTLFTYHSSKTCSHMLCRRIRFFYLGFFHEYSRFTGQQRKGEATFLTAPHHFHLLQNLDIGWFIAAKNIPLRIAGS